MAKQTFSTGQVLTAAQMTSLQQTAMGGGSATAKTASYVLVAADAGTTVAMDAAGATTITVNTALFAAGDTVFIQNLGAGACTVTAGTATVSTAGSLILPQYDAGILYFTSASTAIFYDYIQTGATSPLTTKGDLYGFSTSDARIPIGTNNQVLTADSTQSLGLKWATPSSGGMTLISTTTLSGASITLSSIPQTYNNLYLVVRNYLPASDTRNLFLRFNGDSSASYNYALNGEADNQTSSATRIHYIRETDNTVDKSFGVATIFDYTNTTTWKIGTVYSAGVHTTTTTNFNLEAGMFFWNNTAAISSIVLSPETGNFTSGTAYLYGVK